MERMELVEEFSDRDDTVKIAVVIEAGGTATISNLVGLRKTVVGTYEDKTVKFEGPVGKRLYIMPVADPGFHIGVPVQKVNIMKEPGEYIIDVDFDPDNVTPGGISAFDRDPADSVSNADILKAVEKHNEKLEQLL